MSELIPEKGVCRIVFESTDKEDDYCLDVDAESYIDESETSSYEDDSEFKNKFCNKNGYSKQNEKRKAGVAEEIESSSDTEHECSKKRKKLSKAEQNLSNMPNLLENDNNTIRRSFSHNQCENDPLQTVATTLPEIEKGSFIVSQSYLEMTDAVRKLTEVLVLPINQSKVKEDYVAQQKIVNVPEKADPPNSLSMQEENITRSSRKSCSLSPVSSELGNIKNPLRAFRPQKRNCGTVVSKDCQPNAVFESEKTILESPQNVHPNTEESEKEFFYGSDDAMDFNMAVEALNLLKNKGRTFINLVEEKNHSESHPSSSQSIDSIYRPVSAESNENQVTFLPTTAIEIPSKEEDEFRCSKTDQSQLKHRLLVFDSTLEITDCATGAKIPFESIYQSTNNFYKKEETEFITSNLSPKEIQNEKFTITSPLRQLSDTVTCVKIPLQKSISSNQDQESIVKQYDNSYSTTLQIEETQTDTCGPIIDAALTISRDCVLLAKITQRQDDTIASLNHEANQSADNETNLQRANNSQPEQSTCSNDFKKFKKKTSKLADNKAKGIKSHSKSARELKTKKLPLQTSQRTGKYDDEIEKTRTNVVTRRSSQSSKTSATEHECSSETPPSLKYPTKIEVPVIVELKKTVECKQRPIKTFDANLRTALSTKSKYEPTTSGVFKENKKDNNENLGKVHTNFQTLNSPEQVIPNIFCEEDISVPSLYYEKVKSPLDAFNLIITDSMIQRIVNYTNEKIQGTSKKETTGFLGYKKPTNEIELRAFLGLLLISAALKQNNVIVSELWSECYGAGIYRATLPEGRFYALLHNICFGEVSLADQICQNDTVQIGDPWEEYTFNCKRYPMPMVDMKALYEVDDDDSRHLYTTIRKTTNLPLRILFSMLDAAVVRGSAIFQNENPKAGVCIRTYLKLVGNALVRPQLEARLLKPTTSNSIKELIQCILNKKGEISNKVVLPVVEQTLKKQKRCQLCSWNKDRKTRHQCICCHRKMCKEHCAQLCIQCVESI